MLLTLTIHDLDDVRILECAGRITFGCAHILRIAASQLPPVRTVVLDLRAVDRIDAAGLGILISLRTWAKETGRTIKLMNLIRIVEELLELTHLRTVFEVYSVREMLDLLCVVLDRSHAGGQQPSAPTFVADLHQKTLVSDAAFRDPTAHS